jgi:hypothetical protein
MIPDHPRGLGYSRPNAIASAKNSREIPLLSVQMLLRPISMWRTASAILNACGFSIIEAVTHCWATYFIAIPSTASFAPYIGHQGNRNGYAREHNADSLLDRPVERKESNLRTGAVSSVLALLLSSVAGYFHGGTHPADLQAVLPEYAANTHWEIDPLGSVWV